MIMSLEVTDANVNDVIKNEITVLDFWAQWCGPCRTVGPVIDELADDNETNPDVVVGKVNVDKEQRTAATYGVRTIPTVIFFKNGEMVDKIVGANPKKTYQEKIDSLI